MIILFLKEFQNNFKLAYKFTFKIILFIQNKQNLYKIISNIQKLKIQKKLF